MGTSIAVAGVCGGAAALTGRAAASSRRFGVESYLSWTPAPPVLLQVAYTWSGFTYTNSQSAYGDVRGHPLPRLRIHGLAAGRRALGLVGAIRHPVLVGVVRQALERRGIAGTVTRQPEREGAVVLLHPEGIVDMEPRVRPRCVRTESAGVKVRGIEHSHAVGST